MDRRAQLVKIEAVIKPVIESMGYRLAERDFAFELGRSILRVYIDRESGVNLADCETISRALSASLDVEDCISDAYDLEVSTPGIERPLRYVQDFAKHVGERIQLKTAEPLNGRQNYKGTLTQVDDHTITMDIDDLEFKIPFAELLRAKLLVDWSKQRSKKGT